VPGRRHHAGPKCRGGHGEPDIRWPVHHQATTNGPAPDDQDARYAASRAHQAARFPHAESLLAEALFRAGHADRDLPDHSDGDPVPHQHTVNAITPA
jgi:hypothetical protein